MSVAPPHLQPPSQQPPHVVTGAGHLKSEGFAMPSPGVGRVGPPSRTPPAPVPRQLAMVEGGGGVPGRGQGPPQLQGSPAMTQAPTKIHDQRTSIGSKGSLPPGLQHAAKQTGGFLQPPFAGYEPSALVSWPHSGARCWPLLLCLGLIITRPIGNAAHMTLPARSIAFQWQG